MACSWPRCSGRSSWACSGGARRAGVGSPDSLLERLPALLCTSCRWTARGASMARAFWAWIVCVVVTIAVSLVTQPKPDSELRGIVWGLTEKKEAVEEAWYKKPWVLAVTVLAITVALNIYFW